jgi:hypothetical protein
MRPAGGALAFVVLLSLVTWAGCLSPATQLDQAVWSDDDSELLLIELLFDEGWAPPGEGTTPKENFRHQLYIADADGSDRRVLGEEQEAQNGGQPYLMSAAGYVLWSVVAGDEGKEAFRWMSLDDGTTRALDPLTADVEFGFAVPSPSGAHIALVSSSGGYVEMLDGTTLEVVADASPEALSGNVDWTWTPDGSFVVTDRNRAFAVDTSGVVTEVEVPYCTYPKTTSSRISAEGVMVFVDGETVGFSDPFPTTAFGCPGA